MTSERGEIREFQLVDSIVGQVSLTEIRSYRAKGMIHHLEQDPNSECILYACQLDDVV